MSASRSPKPTTKPARRSYGWLVAAALLAAAGFVLYALPASIALRFLPHDVQATDPSGTLWHGSFAAVSLRGHAIGAVEWNIHPLPLLGGKLSAQLRWIKGGFAVNGVLEARGTHVFVHDVSGGGAIEDLADLGVTRGWSGTAQVTLAELRIEDQKIASANGAVTLIALKSPKFGDADIGGYELALAPESVQPDGTAIAQVRDLGGPLQLSGSLNIVPAQSLLTFSGALKEREGLPTALHQELENLAQMRGRDAQGRVPLEIEFAF
jgi:hypothetical protein